MNKEEDKFFFETNYKKIMLFNELQQHKAFQKLSIDEYRNLINDIVVATSNIEHDLEKGKAKLKLQDEDFWQINEIVSCSLKRSFLEIKE